ncbi:MAG: hypothetical protein FWH02_05770 [Oscillospiraceae bacterium]|nr:hypothetical protein [Oscillospiraceae bacterium]
MTDEQLEAINRYSRRSLTRDEVYVFSVILCDNEVDRDFEQFPLQSLEKLAVLFPGRTGLFDHSPKAEHQSARIFAAEVTGGDTAENSLGEQYFQLKAWAYMLRSEKTRELILEIDGGIKKEVSVGCAVEKAICSICNTDRKSSGCAHEKGKEYDGKLCYHILVNPVDAYEWSFVAIPAQKNAGVTKKYGGALTLGRDSTLEKLFAITGDVLVTKAQSDALAREYIALKAMADMGREYNGALRKEAVRAAALAQPELDPAVLEEVTHRMTPAQLKEFARAFGKAAAKRLPVAPQLAPRGEIIGASAGEGDERFLI